VNTKCPDFKHRKTQNTLWLGDQQNPPWMDQSWWHGSWVCGIGHIFMDQKGLARYVKAGQHEKT